MIALWLGNDLANPAANALGRSVSFVGLYDPVDMSPFFDASAVDEKIASITIVGPEIVDAWDPEVEFNNVDYPHFVRMALNNRITTSGDTQVVRQFYNASHGAIGGTPGYNPDMWSQPLGSYNYEQDVSASISADRDIRAGLQAAGFWWVGLPDPEWYGFPEDRPI